MLLQVFVPDSVEELLAHPQRNGVDIHLALCLHRGRVTLTGRPEALAALLRAALALVDRCDPLGDEEPTVPWPGPEGGAG